MTLSPFSSSRFFGTEKSITEKITLKNMNIVILTFVKIMYWLVRLTNLPQIL